MTTSAMYSYSPAWAIARRAIVGFDLNWTIGFSLRGLDVECASDADLEAMSGALCLLLEALPEGVTARFLSQRNGRAEQRLAFSGSAPSAKSFDRKFLRAKREYVEGWANGTQQGLFLFLSAASTSNQRSFSERMVQSFFRRASWASSVRRAELETVERLEQAAVSCESHLASLGIGATRLDSQALYRSLWRLANPTIDRQPPPYVSHRTLRDQLFQYVARQYSDRFVRDKTLHRVVTFLVPPATVIPTQIQCLQQIPFDHLLSITVKKCDSLQAKKKISSLAVNANELAMLKRGGLQPGGLSDPLLSAQFEESDAAAYAMMQGESMVEVAMHFCFFAETEKALNERTDVVAHQIRRCGAAEMAVEEMQVFSAFLSMLPGHDSLIGDRFFPTLASSAADLLPVFQSWSGSKNPLTYFQASGGQPIGFHPFDPELSSWNACISGGTGKGKSVLVRYLLSSWMMAGGRAIIVTRGKDYERFGEMFEAKSLTFSSVSMPALGPFPQKKYFLSIDLQDEYVENLSSMVALLCCEPEARCTMEQKNAIRLAIQKTFSLVSEEESPTFKEFIQACFLLREERGQESGVAYAFIANRVSYWLQTPFRDALLKNITSDDTPLQIWDLEGIKDPHAQSVILGLLSAAMASSLLLGRTQFILDEVWSLFRSEEGALLIENAYRTIRKKKGSITIVSQGVADFQSLPERLRNAILNNAEVQFILPHSAAEWPLAEKLFHLNERERVMFRGLQSAPGKFSEFLGFFGLRHKKMILRLTPLEYWMSTSHPEDIQMEDLRKKRVPHESMQDRLRYLSEKYPKGAVGLFASFDEREREENHHYA